jgi:hypothetical protein
MTATNIQNLSIGTLDMSRPFDKPFTKEEATHIAALLSDPTAREKVHLSHFSRDGFDGETFHYAGIRTKNGEAPKQFDRVYQGGLVNLGFIDHPPESLNFIRAVRAAGIEVDSFLLHLIQ